MMDRVLIYRCKTCFDEGRTREDVSHTAKCLIQRLDTNTMTVTPPDYKAELWSIRLCVHGQDVTLSPHECNDCSIAIAEYNCS